MAIADGVVVVEGGITRSQSVVIGAVLGVVGAGLITWGATSYFRYSFSPIVGSIGVYVHDRWSNTISLCRGAGASVRCLEVYPARTPPAASADAASKLFDEVFTQPK